MAGKEAKGLPFEEALDLEAQEDSREEEWLWGMEINKQKIRKRRVPEREEGAAPRKRRGGRSHKKE